MSADIEEFPKVVPRVQMFSSFPKQYQEWECRYSVVSESSIRSANIQ
jgi:hypothetical protein